MRDIEELVPDAKIQKAHGQMRESELEQIMLDFYHARFNVLVSTTIIENGIDLPNANTIIINRADKLGLSNYINYAAVLGAHTTEPMPI